MRRWLLLLLALFAAGCDRAALDEVGEDGGPSGPDAGTFVAEAGSLRGGGYERLEGTATFGVVETAEVGPVLVVRLRSVFEGVLLPDSVVVDTSYVDLALARATVPPSGTYSFADAAELASASDIAFVACYRTDAFPDGPYRSAEGTLDLSTSTVPGAERLAGSFALEVYARRPTGSGTLAQQTLPVTGRFTALPQPLDTLDVAALYRCSAK